jgi:hypothetical protein
MAIDAKYFMQGSTRTLPGRFYRPESMRNSAEYVHALARARTLWGDGAFVLDQSTLREPMFIVSSGKVFTPRHYGEGASWDEAFIAAGSSLFAGQAKVSHWWAKDMNFTECGLKSSEVETVVATPHLVTCSSCLEGLDVLTQQADGTPVVYTSEQRDRDKGREPVSVLRPAIERTVTAHYDDDSSTVCLEFWNGPQWDGNTQCVHTEYYEQEDILEMGVDLANWVGNGLAPSRKLEEVL